MKWLFPLLLFLLASSCRSTKCSKAASVYPDVYRRYLIILKDSQRPSRLVMPFEQEEALDFITRVSKLPTRAVFSGSWHYQNRRDWNKDLRDWKRWLNKNKCRLTIGYVDSIGVKIRS